MSNFQINKSNFFNSLSISPGPLISESRNSNSQPVEYNFTINPDTFFNQPQNNSVETNLPNWHTIEEYFKIVYKNHSKPNINDMTFIWIHLAGNLDHWAQNGVPGRRSSFRCVNQPLRRPLRTSDDMNSESIIWEIIQTLPPLHVIWTPDWFSYPQAAINRYDPQAWNQRYFDILVDKMDENGSYLNIQEDQRFEVSNTGGPAEYSGKYEGYRTFFFYQATGSGIQVVLPRVMYAMNKIHAVYIGKCYVANSGLSTQDLDENTLKAAFLDMFTVLSDVFQGRTLIEQMEDALTLKSGYFGLGDSDDVKKYLWDPIVQAYPVPQDLSLPGVLSSEDKGRLYATLMYNIGASSSSFPQPNIKNADCVASNAFKGLLTLPGAVPPATGVSKIAEHPNLAMEDCDCQGIANISQWNALGGWTCEIPSYYGKAITTPAPDLVALNGGELLDSWWSGDGGILGINSYVSHNAKFDIPKEYL